jgi:hypothetical protein
VTTSENFCPDVAPYEPTATPRPTADTIPGEGKFRVGSDVQPGKYISQPVVAGQLHLPLSLFLCTVWVLGYEVPGPERRQHRAIHVSAKPVRPQRD